MRGFEPGAFGRTWTKCPPPSHWHTDARPALPVENDRRPAGENFSPVLADLPLPPRGLHLVPGRPLDDRLLVRVLRAGAPGREAPARRVGLGPVGVDVGGGPAVLGDV